ncbi:transcriptional regulator, MerR family [Catenulispora acidiphila DSM 44928]|uniref:Transcriptional regulator, MerR family n=1 Tax=Catenulispora acidiphila (strain DSM 44928 / JCM 14897 / NBRC 102108 / NRRL B-24433 / ID139908) TaxID=479433 RepID=C7Q845_CATAD|nr:MerR family transcriptional regulator [Catenulispora acidiphila]ACU74212.1 transcriptional regulator, MerR family [Catenulispora acidiphila DSM 44928]
MTIDNYSPAQTVEMSGFSLDTLRYYEKIGLIEPVRRAAGGHRRYTDDDLGWLDMLRCLRGTGMPIAQMQTFAELVRDGDGTVTDRLALLEEHDANVEAEMERLIELRRKIQEKIAYYRSYLAEMPVECVRE